MHRVILKILVMYLDFTRWEIRLFLVDVTCERLELKKATQ